jgi:hypothetical protein
VLAFLGADASHHKGPFKPSVRKALEWLEEQQEPDGKFRYRNFYEQGIATMALCEAYGLTRDPRVGRKAQRALDHIQQQQPEHGGFRYQGGTTKEGGDLCCSGWQMTAIALGVCAELHVREQAFARSRVLLANTWRGEGHSAYLVNSQNPGSLAMSSIGMLSRVFLGDERHHEEVRQTASLLYEKETDDGRPVRGGRTRQLVSNLYYTCFASQAMFQASDAMWAKWAEMVRDPLLEAQVQADADAQGRLVRGSWDPAKHKFGKGAGRAYATAMAVLTLETPYRYRRIHPKAILPPADF